MDPALYKDITTTRGLRYHYYFSAARDAQPTLLFAHGFPSTSADWRHQAAFFSAKGFGVIVPDMLGYGGTAKPEDPAAYVSSLITKDLVDLLDAEKIDKVIAIGHDWGSQTISRFINFYPERVAAAGFLALGYVPPNPEKTDIQTVLDATKKIFGYELFGYFLFFDEEGNEDIVKSHWDSFHSLIWPRDSELWKTDLAPSGTIKAWLLADKRAPLPPYITEEEKAAQKTALLTDSFRGPVNWYKVAVRGFTTKDDELIPVERYDIQQPVFFGGCSRDFICRTAMSQARLATHVKNATYKEFDADHWVLLSHADEVNKELLEWIKKL